MLTALYIGLLLVLVAAIAVLAPRIAEALCRDWEVELRDSDAPLLPIGRRG